LPQRWDWRLLAAQDQPPPKPTFKSAVDLVPVDVNVTPARRAVAW
jgi:hypothetical protein